MKKRRKPALPLSQEPQVRLYFSNTHVLFGTSSRVPHTQGQGKRGTLGEALSS